MDHPHGARLSTNVQQVAPTHLPPILMMWLYTRRRKTSNRPLLASFREQLWNGKWEAHVGEQEMQGEEEVGGSGRAGTVWVIVALAGLRPRTAGPDGLCHTLTLWHMVGP